jgi:hypothetical protein
LALSPTSELAETSRSGATSVGSSALFAGSNRVSSADCSAITAYSWGRSRWVLTVSSGSSATA